MANPFAAQLADALETSWTAIGPNQLPPPEVLAGLAAARTTGRWQEPTLAEWVCYQAASGQAGRIALVAATAADAREVLVEGQSGVLTVSPPWFRPSTNPRNDG
jgi:phage terminase large subunit-like protein